MYKELAILALTAAPLASAAPSMWDDIDKSIQSLRSSGVGLQDLGIQQTQQGGNSKVGNSKGGNSQGGNTQGESGGTSSGNDGWSLTWQEDWQNGWQDNWLAMNGTGYYDSNYWNPPTNGTWPPNWGTGEVERMTDDATVLKTDKNGLNIAPRKDSTGQWISSRIETKNEICFMACDKGLMKIEANLMLPEFKQGENALGLWPAFWLMGKSFRAGVTWPTAAEIDVMENVNGQDITHWTVHCDVNPGGVCNEPNGNGKTGNFTRGAYHTHTLVIDRTASTWQEESMNWYVDGKLTRTLKGSELVRQDIWEAAAHQSLFIILNVAIGGGFTDGVSGKKTPEADTVQSQGMQVKDVKVWHKNCPNIASISH